MGARGWGGVGTPIFQMGLIFLEKAESLTPTFEIQVRTLRDSFQALAAW